MFLLGITGKARAGKDTAAAYFCKQGWRRTAHADALKRMAAAMVGEHWVAFTDDVLKEQVTPVLGITRRRVLQDLGSVVKPLFGDDVWSRVMFHAIENNHFGDRVVIPDVRYDYEAQAIIDRGGFILEVTRQGVGLTGEAAAHHSENGINPDLIDFTVDNDGSIGELEAELRKIRQTIEAKRD